MTTAQRLLRTADDDPKRLGEALGEEARAAAFAALFENATEYAVLTTDPDNRITSWSPGARIMLGWDEAEVLGRSGALIFTPEDRERGAHEAERATALAAGQARDDRWHLRKDGSRLWSNGVLAPMRDRAGRVAGFVKVFRDKTEQHLERDRLAAQAEVLESITDAFYALDDAERLTYANARALEFWGRRPEEVLGGTFADVFPDTAGGEVHAALRRVAAERRAAHLEIPSTIPAGRWLSASIYPAAAGGLAVYFRDVTDRKRAEDAVRESEERHRLAMRAVDAMVFDWDVPSGTVKRSEGLRRLLGFEADEAEPTAAWWRSRVHPDDARARGRPAEQAMARGAERFEVEYRVRHRDGHWVDVLDTGYVLYGDDGRPLRAVGSSVDVTQRRRAEEDLRQRNLRLEILAEAAARLISGDDPDEAVEGLFRAVAERLDVDACISFSVDDAAGALRLEDHVGVPEEAARHLAQLGFGRTVCGVVAQTRQPAYVVDVQASDDPVTAYIRALGVRAYASYPLTAGERLLGTMSFASRHRDRFEEEELAYFRTVSHHVAAAKERRRAEEELRASGARFRAVADLVPDLLWRNDPTGHADWCNQRWLEHTGQSAEEALGHGWLDAMHPDDRERSLANFRASVNAGQPPRHEQRIRGVDGTYRWFLVGAQPMRDERGRIVHWFGAATDIHEQRAAMEALRESEGRFRQFAENSAEVLWIIDAATVRLEYLSPAYERVWGESRDAVVADLARWALRVHPDDRAQAGEGLSRALAGEAVVKEYRIVRPDGGVRWIRDTGFPVPDPDGTVRRVGGIAQDVTEDREHERRQAVLVAELQHRVKNILANVQSLARQTRARSRTLDGFAEAFGGRLDALARTQKLVTRNPEGRAGVREILDGELAAYAGKPGQVGVSGPEVALETSKAQAFQLAIHELATNAAKYGAFATESGHLEVAWEVGPSLGGAAGGERLRLRWRETGVPITDTAPARGFGSEIVERSLPYMLGGTAALTFHPDGVECAVEFPLTRGGGGHGRGGGT